MVKIMPIDKDISSHHFLSNPPKVCEWVCQGGGDGEGAEEDVGESKVDQEDVARCPHHLEIWKIWWTKYQNYVGEGRGWSGRCWEVSSSPFISHKFDALKLQHHTSYSNAK